MLGVVRKVFFFLDGRTRWQVLGLLPLMLASGLLESLSIAMIVPLAEVVLVPDGRGGWSGRIRELVGLDGFAFALAMGLGFVALYLFKNTAVLVIQFSLNRFTMRKLAAFQDRLFRHYLARPYSDKLAENSALILRNLTVGAPAVFDALRASLTIVLESFLLAAAGLMVVAVQPWLSLGALVLLGGAGVTFHLVGSPRFKRWGQQAHAASGRQIKWAMQGMAALKDIQVMGRQPYFERRFAAESDQLAAVRAWRQVSTLLPRVTIESVVMVAGVAALLALWGRREAIDAVLSSLAVIGLAVMRMIPSLNRILGTTGDLRHFQADVEALHAELSRRSPAEPAPAEPATAAAAVAPLPFVRSLEVRGVSFTYDGGARPALEGVSLSLAPGEAVGVIGPSGSGKSTLMDLLLGLHLPAEGGVTLDGSDIFAALPAWRAGIGFVPQAVVLLDDTLRRNIAFGIDDDAIDERRLAEAVGMAQLDEVVASLPDGLAAVIGEGGCRLSGGQRQRVGIARALYRDPAILIFDEATSALDSATEREVVAAIGALKGKKSMVIVAHRLSTVAGCDRIALLTAGRIVDQGSLAELAARHPDIAHGLSHGATPA